MGTVTITMPLKAAEFPAGTVEGALRFRVYKGSLIQTSKDVLPPENTATFSLAAGDYTFNVQRMSDKGLPIGDVYSGSFTVEAPPPVMVNVPDSSAGATVSVS